MGDWYAVSAFDTTALRRDVTPAVVAMIERGETIEWLGELVDDRLEEARRLGHATGRPGRSPTTAELLAAIRSSGVCPRFSTCELSDGHLAMPDDDEALYVGPSPAPNECPDVDGCSMRSPGAPSRTREIVFGLIQSAIGARCLGDELLLLGRHGGWLGVERWCHPDERTPHAARMLAHPLLLRLYRRGAGLAGVDMATIDGWLDPSEAGELAERLGEALDAPVDDVADPDDDAAACERLAALRDAAAGAAARGTGLALVHG